MWDVFLAGLVLGVIIGSCVVHVFKYMSKSSQTLERLEKALSAVH